MVDTARAGKSASLRRDAILEAVAFAAEQLLLSPDWRDVVNDILARLGIAADVSRSYLFESRMDDAGRERGTMRYEWCAPGVEPQIDNPALADLCWAEAGFARWPRLMHRGASIHGTVAGFPQSERPLLERQGIRSLACFPIVVGGDWGGLIGLDDCREERDWGSAELDALRAAASVLSATIQRQHSEEQLRDAERRYRAFVERIPAVTYTDLPGPDLVRMGFVSPQIEGILGYPAQAFLDDPTLWMSLIHPEDQARLRAESAIDQKDLSPFDEEYRMTAADGRTVWVHDTSTAILGEDGTVDYFQGFMVDVTARKEAEQQLRRAEERYRALIEHIPTVVYTEGIVEDLEALYISPQVESLLGYTPSEWCGAHDFWRDRVHPDDEDRVFAANDESIRTGEPFVAEYRLRANDGRWVWVRDEAFRVLDARGEPLYWLGVLLDIRQRKTAEEALRDSFERTRLILDSAIDAVITIGQDGRITGWNPQAEETFGWSREEALGRGLAETIIPPALRTLHRDGMKRYLETGEERVLNRRIEVSALNRFGNEFPVELSISPVRTGDRLEFSAFIRDISERKRAQRELERSLEVEREAATRLRALDEMKNTFLQAVSHDLRTPLAAILGLAITLERGDVQLETADAHDIAGRIAENARRLDRLVTNLLDLDRLARGIVEPKLRQTDVADLVGRILEESKLIAPERLRIDLRPVVMPVDAAKVERIVENLVANTARHAPPEATVWVSLRPTAEGVLILVEDDGPGIAPELRDVIFEPFQQGPNVARHSPGVGVGLTLVRRFAELHGGNAWVEDREGGGASFRVFLSAVAPSVATASADAMPDDRESS